MVYVVYRIFVLSNQNKQNHQICRLLNIAFKSVSCVRYSKIDNIAFHKCLICIKKILSFLDRN